MIDWILIIKFFSLKDEVNKPEDESNKFDKFYEIFDASFKNLNFKLGILFGRSFKKYIEILNIPYHKIAADKQKYEHY